MAETKISDMIAKSLENIHDYVDANTIIGKPIDTASGTTIIPVSKISLGVATGGADYQNKNDSAKDNFGGGGGTGVQVIPVAFLVVRADGSVELMNVSNPTSRPADIGYNVSSLVDRAPEIIEKIKAMFRKKPKDEDGSGAQEEKPVNPEAENPPDTQAGEADETSASGEDADEAAE